VIICCIPIADSAQLNIKDQIVEEWDSVRVFEDGHWDNYDRRLYSIRRDFLRRFTC